MHTKRTGLYNANDLRVLFVKATSNKYAESTRRRARKQLEKIAERQRSRANSRIAALRSSGYDYGQAYDNAQNYIESHYGTGAKSFYKEKNLGNIYEQALSVSAFLQNKQSMVKGQKVIERKRFDTFRDRGEPFESMTDDQLRDFLKFLGNSNVGDYLNFYDESGEELEQVAIVWQDESKREQLLNLFEEYTAYLKDIDAGVEPKEAGGISADELRKSLYALYTSESKRKR